MQKNITIFLHCSYFVLMLLQLQKKEIYKLRKMQKVLTMFFSPFSSLSYLQYRLSKFNNQNWITGIEPKICCQFSLKDTNPNLPKYLIPTNLLKTNVLKNAFLRTLIIKDISIKWSNISVQSTHLCINQKDIALICSCEIKLSSSFQIR